MLQSISGAASANEHDPLISKETSDQDSQLVSLSNSNYYNVSSEGTTSPFVHARSKMTNEHYHRLDDSKDHFCKRRGVSLIFCFALISLLFVIVVIFKTQFLTLLGYQDAQSQLLFEQYEQDWETLEFVDDKHVPKNWEWDTSCGSSHYFDLTFAVSIQNADKLTEELMKTSMPDSPTYGQHWTPERVHEFFAPKQESINEIFAWLQYHGVAKEDISFATESKDYIRINVDCHTANRMLNTEFGFWNNLGADRAFDSKLNGEEEEELEEQTQLRVRDGYSVPAVVRQHLDFISPTLRFPMRHHTKTVELIGSLGSIDMDAKEDIMDYTKSSYVTPTKLTDMYHLEDYLDTAASPNNSQAIASFLMEWFNYADYYLFQTYFDITRTVLLKNPSDTPSGDGDEAELDVEYITSTGRGIETIAYDIEDDLYFITLAQRVADSHHPPFVVSISYGGDEQSNGWGYCNRASIELGKVSLLGVTFFVSSGDEGAAGTSGCDDYDEFAPSFPATSPYVVAVGGTEGGKVQSDVDDSTQEAAWTDSGGGFSTYFTRMAFQDAAVDAYFNISADDLPTQSYWNRTGRAYPDISALSVYYIVCIDKSLYSVSGTSCSSPAVAGMFSQINDLRLQHGLSSLGWVNPRLYGLFDKSQSEYFNDVLEGYNEGCSVDNYVGFEAAKGWDPVTGVGTPKFSKMALPLIYF